MKPAQVTIRLLICALAGACWIASAAETAPSVEAPKKKGWLERVKSVVGLGKEEAPPAPPPPPPEPAPKPKAQTSTPKKSSASTKATTSKPKPKPAPKPEASKPKAEPKTEPAKTETKPKEESTPPAPEKKPEAAPATTPTTAEVPKKTEPEKKDPPPAKPEVTAETKTPAPAPAADKSTTTKVDMNLDSEFATLNKDEPPPQKAPAPAVAETKPAPEPAKPTTTPKLPPSGAGAAWQIYEHNGHDYVTAESMHRFYRFSEFKVSGEHVWFKNPTLIMKGRVGSLDMLINNIKFVLSYPVVVLNGKVCFSRLDLAKLLDPVIRPWLITQGEPFDTVIIDPGHGGHDSGAKGVYGYEKDFALKLAESVRAALLKRGFKVVMTRQDDRFISLGGRVRFANAVPKSIFISLHFNSASTSASGIETFALTPQGGSSTAMGAREWDAKSFTGNVRDAENIALATAVHAMVMHRFKLIDRGIKRARWSVLTGCTRPGILFEGGFVTNQTEGRLIASQLYRDQLANAISDAVLNYRAALHPRTAQKR